jgi:hypothetical protein
MVLQLETSVKHGKGERPDSQVNNNLVFLTIMALLTPRFLLYMTEK